MLKKVIAGPHGSIEVEMTAEEEAALRAEWEAPPPPLPLSEQLHGMFEVLAPELQADLAPLKAAVKLELDQGRVDIARLIIERAPVPAELEPLRKQMLEAFT